MIVSEQWLRDWVHVDLNAQQIADCLTNAGLEVDGVESLAGSIDNLVIGKVLEVSRHPDADRLNLTKVEIGDEQLDIVCGASNVRPVYWWRLPPSVLSCQMALRSKRLRFEALSLMACCVQPQN